MTGTYLEATAQDVLMQTQFGKNIVVKTSDHVVDKISNPICCRENKIAILDRINFAILAFLHVMTASRSARLRWEVLSADIRGEASSRLHVDDKHSACLMI